MKKYKVNRVVKVSKALEVSNCLHLFYCFIYPQIMRAGTQASDRDRDPDPDLDHNGVAV